jgi:hypothetical protein
MTDQEIIDKAVEKALLMIPEVVGNLMANHAAMHKTNMDFYERYPEFRDKKNIVASILEKVEGENPLMKHEDLLNKAVPFIKQRVELTKNLDMNVPSTVNRDFSNNGVI